VAEAIQLATRAKAQDPLGDIRLLSWLQYANGEWDQANLSLLRLIELYPTAETLHYHRALVLLALGKPADALSEMELEPSDPFREIGRALVLDALGRGAEANSILASAEPKFGSGAAYQIASVYAGRKDWDRTFH
jgi:tetratricopeptide (TPR) repeat protein